MCREDFTKKRAELEARQGEDTVNPTEKRKSDFSKLDSGDFYLTRHSNLCETHVVFHLIADENLDDGNVRLVPNLKSK